MVFGQLHPLVEGRPAGELAVRLLPDVPELIPVELPASWLPATRAALRRGAQSLLGPWSVLGDLPLALVGAPHVLPAARADRALGLVGRVPGRLGEDRLVHLVDLAAYERQERGSLQEVGWLAARELAQRG